RPERFPALVAELLSRKVDLIVTRGTPAAVAAKEATSTIPVVMAAIADPLLVVRSLARPGGNLTGFSSLLIDLTYQTGPAGQRDGSRSHAGWLDLEHEQRGGARHLERVPGSDGGRGHRSPPARREDTLRHRVGVRRRTQAAHQRALGHHRYAHTDKSAAHH